MSTSESYFLQKERTEPAELEVWNERQREGRIAQENELPFSELPNNFRPYRKPVTIYRELQGLQHKFR